MASAFDIKESGSKSARMGRPVKSAASAKPKAPNKAMLATGAERTATVRGFIDFSKLKISAHRQHLVEELCLRGKQATNTQKGNLRSLFRECEGDTVEPNGTKVFFKPLTRHFDSMLGVTEPVDTPVDKDTDPIDTATVDTETDDGAPRRSTRQRQPNPRYEDSV